MIALQKVLSTLNDTFDFGLLIRIGLLFLLPFAGLRFGSALAYASLNGEFVRWESIGTPPGKAAKIIAVTQPAVVETETGHIWQKALFVQTELGLVYRYDYYKPKCREDCWVVSTDAEPGPEQSKSVCREAPIFPNAKDSRSLCTPPTYTLTVYAIDQDGTVFVWEHSVDEYGALLVGLWSFLGLSAGLIAAIISWRKTRPRPIPPAPAIA